MEDPTRRLLCALNEARRVKEASEYEYSDSDECINTVVVEALSAGADPNAQLADGTSAVYAAAHLPNGHVIVAALISAGCNVQPCTIKGRLHSPLHPAVRFGNPETVAALLSAGTGLMTLDYYGRSPLMQLAWRWPKTNVDDSAVRILRMLLEYGADLNACNPIEMYVSGSSSTVHADSALHAACVIGNAYIANAMLGSGANAYSYADEVRQLCPGSV